jgi:hypothetical protein
VKKTIRFLTAILLAVMLLPTTVSASESSSYTYTQSVDKEWIRTQDAYMPGTIFLNDGTLSAPEDLFIFGNKIYIADAIVGEDGKVTGGQIVVYDMDSREIVTFGKETLVNPMGLFVTEEAIYVADKGAQAVFKLSHTGDVLMALGRPESYLFSEQSQYLPTAVAVSSQGIIFVCGEGAYEGLMQFDKNGVFQGYFAANATKMTFADRVKELVFNEEQMEQLLNRIPNALYNVDISDRDLIYSITQLEANSVWTTAVQTENAMKYHNMAGTDILSTDLIEGEHNFVDVAAYRDGLSLAVTNTGIIYEYDSTGNVIFSFGGMASTERSGHFTNATAIDIDDSGNIYILDREGKYFQMFFPTDFANATHEALYKLSQGSYEESEDTWLELLSLNGMSYVAHQGYGKVLYQQMRFEEAAEEFKIIGDKASYSECMWEIRNNWFQSSLPYVLVILILLFILSFVKKILMKKGILKKRKPTQNRYVLDVKRNWSYMVKMLKNPIDEFYDLKKKIHGSTLSATVLFILAFAIYLVDMFGRSFAFRFVDTKGTALLSTAVMFLVPAVLWVIGNYMISAINDGEGTLRSVYVATAYSLVPYIIFGPIVIASTYVLTLNEAVIVHYLWAIAIAWSAILIFVSVREIHDYTIKETVKIILLTLFFMIMAVIVCVILYLIGQQVVLFFRDIISEVTYHV